MQYPVASPEDAYLDGTVVIIFCTTHVFDHHLLLHCFAVVVVDSKRHTGCEDIAVVGAAERMPLLITILPFIRHRRLAGTRWGSHYFFVVQEDKGILIFGK